MYTFWNQKVCLSTAIVLTCPLIEVLREPKKGNSKQLLITRKTLGPGFVLLKLFRLLDRDFIKLCGLLKIHKNFMACNAEQSCGLGDLGHQWAEKRISMVQGTLIIFLGMKKICLSK